MNECSCGRAGVSVILHVNPNDLEQGWRAESCIYCYEEMAMQVILPEVNLYFIHALESWSGGIPRNESDSIYSRAVCECYMKQEPSYTKQTCQEFADISVMGKKLSRSHLSAIRCIALDWKDGEGITWERLPAIYRERKEWQVIPRVDPGEVKIMLHDDVIRRTETFIKALTTPPVEVQVKEIAWEERQKINKLLDKMEAKGGSAKDALNKLKQNVIDDKSPF